MPRITKAQERAMFAFVTFVHDHHPVDFQHLLTYGTATDKLVELGQDTTSAHASPFSLATSRGIRCAWSAAKMVRAWKNDIPYMAYLLRPTLLAVAAKAREEKSRKVLAAAVDAILTRAAMERRRTVMFSFESLQVAIKVLTGEQPGMYLLRSALEHLNRGSADVSIKFGKRGAFSKSTEITLTYVTHSNQVVKQADVNKGLVQDWLDEQGQWIVRVHQHEARLKHTLAERKAEYAAKVGVNLDLDEWIRGNTIVLAGRSYVNWPGEEQGGVLLLDRVEVQPQAGKTGVPMPTPDSMPSDLQLKKFDVPKRTAPAPAPRPRTRPHQWRQRRAELHAAGATWQEQILDGLDLSIPAPPRRTWKQVKAEYEQASLERLRERLAAKSIPWDA